MAKGFRAARFDHVVFTDSNVFLPTDYLDQLMAALESGTGMVSAPPVGQAPEGLWAELECAFLNSYQARIQYAVDTLGLGFAQGKTLFFRRADLEQGGLAKLASEPAEDAAATKLMRAAGKTVRLAGPFAQLIGRRSFSQVWNRQVRWARLRKTSFPALFAPEILAGAIPAILALASGLGILGLPWLPAGALFLVVWYLSELILVRIAGWPRSLTAMLLRDLLLPAVYVAGLMGRSFEWHGQHLQAVPGSLPDSNIVPHPQLGLGSFGDV
jgi:ceramide glucosyltransferase